MSKLTEEARIGILGLAKTMAHIESTVGGPIATESLYTLIDKLEAGTTEGTSFTLAEVSTMETLMLMRGLLEIAEKLQRVIPEEEEEEEESTPEPSAPEDDFEMHAENHAALLAKIRALAATCPENLKDDEAYIALMSLETAVAGVRPGDSLKLDEEQSRAYHALCMMP